MSGKNAGEARSVLDRLKTLARKDGVDPQIMQIRYGHERFLYRLSRTPAADQFILKGAMLMVAWFGETLRPTRDIDLLGFGDVSETGLLTALRTICGVEVEFDGMEYDPETIQIEEIRNEDEYGGRRVTLVGFLGASRILIQIDIGVGDAVAPPAEYIDYPSLLDLPTPRLRGYRKETAIAEKLHAMVRLGEINSRMKDFFDVYMLASRNSFEEDALRVAIRATFERRTTSIPIAVPSVFTRQFATAPERQTQWKAFLNRNSLDAVPVEFSHVMPVVAEFLWPVLEDHFPTVGPPRTWKAGEGWIPSAKLPP